MSGIRVTYSGLISFGVGILTIITGLVFTIIVTRQLSVEELGTWTLVGGLIVYILIAEPVISYWTTREIARKEKSGRTAIFSSGFLSMIGMITYVIIVLIVSENTEVDNIILLFAVILIPVTFLHRTLSAINFGWKPHVVSYGHLVFEITKIPLGLLLVYFLELGVMGAILTTTFSHIFSIVILLVYAREKLTKTFEVRFLKKWMRLFWISLYPGITNFITKSDILVFTLITDSVIGLAYYTASLSVSSLVKESGAISRAIYPKLLSENKKEILQENLTRFFYFAIPLTAISFTFMKGGLFALNPIYEIATTVVIFLTLRTALMTFSSIIQPALTGIEKVDMNEKATFRDYFNSKLFHIPTINIIRSIVYITSLIIGFLFIATNSQLEVVILWSIISFIVEIPFSIYIIILVQKNFPLKINYQSILKYIIVSIIVFGTTYFITEEYLEYEISIFKFLPNLLIFVILSIVGYLSITYFIDSRTKNLMKSIINEIRKNK